ncbi:tetratricopeptide repeat protein [Flavobacterium macacae]|uniref:Tetratricopeptide repeat protein n=1 Tax=Flavobacterium macacae TaxID=2488993 RepID=A0A3P3W3S3_9FLAO|nr:hypothetical protein [Flavobacterium macacae]RRJ89725.1 hypothetical protein EG849_11980 [Flavobacterium macacae]
MFDDFFKKREEMPLALRAISALQKGNYQEALKLFDEYILMVENQNLPLNEDDASFYYNRSIAKSQLDDIDGAMEDLVKCLRIAELHQAYLELFNLYRFKQDAQTGTKYLIRAYELGNKEAEKVLRENTNYFNR